MCDCLELHPCPLQEDGPLSGADGVVYPDSLCHEGAQVRGRVKSHRGKAGAVAMVARKPPISEDRL